MKIIKYINSHDIDIEFENGGLVKHSSYALFKSGQIANPLHPTVFGVGYLGNDSEGAYLNSRKPSKAYMSWRGMLKRCYSNNSKKEYPAYQNCYVCEEWKCFSTFKKWFDENYYEVEGETMCLDKDILIKNNKMYSPNACMFTPHRINAAFIRKSRKDNNLPMGIYETKSGDKYSAQCFINGKNKQLGTFKTVEGAFNTYKIAKEKEIKRIADEYKDKIPQKLYDAMYGYEVEITD